MPRLVRSATVLRLPALVAALALVVAACGGSDEAEPSAVSVGGDGEVFAGQVEGLDGDPIDLAAFAETDAIVWFWAPW